MEIITQNYEKILENLIINNFSEIIKENENRNLEENKVFNYIRILDTLDNKLCEIAIKSLTTIIESIDRGFRNSPERRHRFHIKANTTRTIMTVFGEVTYRKTIYSYKYKEGSYCYVDDYLGLKKYDYFDPYIRSLILEYAADNPYSKVAKIVNNMINNRIKINEANKYISRQTVRNIILSSPLSKPQLKELDTPEDIYIMADEKFIHTQNNNKEDVMVKELVVFDGREKINKRTKLSNKMIFSSFGNSDYLNDCLDYLYYVYDLEKVKNVYFMGDGAKWIKNTSNYFKFNNNTNVTFNLDRYHFMQAIHHICQNKDMDRILSSYILNNDKDNFNMICECIINSNPLRTDTINEKRKYLLSNWKYIINLDKNKLKCPMESQISHNLAALFASRPKSYSIKSLNILLNLRMLYRNKHNIKLLYLNNYNKKDILTINEEYLNYSILNPTTNIYFDKSIIPENYNPYHFDSSIIGLTL